ncbi:MAG: hypothetical protein MSIBF_05315 [Candidatus Altiarchaeales archaeon IMC4]|nr:MAG: hypothetical protein MSIBF_05315 [Candidatus Altiarchaeales archaeon IMC4]
MCGIAGYIGERDAFRVVFEMLGRLEYRGYDSAGVACINKNAIHITKDKGKVAEVEKEAAYADSKVAIAHTRWATHGVPSRKNAHPHKDCKGKIAVVHNGIIENFEGLRARLVKRGHKFLSETDTEVIPHLIEEEYKDGGGTEAAFVSAIKKLGGSFAVAMLSDKENNIFIARHESPLIVGIGNGENFVASDIPALLPLTKKVIVLDDGEYGIVGKQKVVIKKINSGRVVNKKPKTINWSMAQAEKGGFEHFMIKEIHEEPQAVKNAIAERTDIEKIAKKLAKFPRIYFVACGTASYAGRLGRGVLEHFGVPSNAEIGSEFRYGTSKTIDKNCAVILVSQSGETADTIAAAKEAKKNGAYVVGVVNVLGSTLTGICDDVIDIGAGPEIAVASTKAYVGQITSLTLLGLFIAKEKGKLDVVDLNKLISKLGGVPEKISHVIGDKEKIKRLAEKYRNVKEFFYIGRGLNYPNALEGALKLKEISYVHAEAYPAGELKHGPLALLEKGVVVFALVPNDHLAKKMESNVQEAKSRNAEIAVVSEGGDIKVPWVDPLLSPLLYVVPLHLFAYYLSVSKGLDPDKPRNLAKSVTVE